MSSVEPRVEVVLPAGEFERTLAFFVDDLGFRLETIFPADAPQVAVVGLQGMRVRLDARCRGDAGALRIHCTNPRAFRPDGRTEFVAPNGTRIEVVSDEPSPVVPSHPATLVVTCGAGHFVPGRAGMRYRDLIPGRQGGRVIASHIQVPNAGVVPDYPHWHHVRFQMIYCYRGWVRVVYEDQGPDFVLEAGDCVLQPPTIRHRVLESSAGLEVIEMACPAEHETVVAHDTVLPTPVVRPERRFGGQLFVRHEAARATWRPWRSPGFDCRDLGVAAATDGMADACVIRASGASRVDVETMPGAGEFGFYFVLDGGATLHVGPRAPQRLTTGDCFLLPYPLACSLEDVAPGTEFLRCSILMKNSRSPLGCVGADPEADF